MSLDDPGGMSRWKIFLIAVQFLTRIPVSISTSDGFDHRDALRASVVYFPLVGLCIGVFTSGVYALALSLWPPAIAALLAIAAEAWLTGAFHEDALADATDALGGGWNRERVLEILKDSRHGTFGVMAIVLGVGLRVFLVAESGLAIGLIAIPVSSMFGRWSILWLMTTIPPIEDRQTMVRDVGGQASWGTFIASGLIAIAFGLLALGTIFGLSVWARMLPISMLPMGDWARLSLLIICASLLISILFGRYVKRRVGGITGDFLGANCFLVQLAVLLVFVAWK